MIAADLNALVHPADAIWSQAHAFGVLAGVIVVLMLIVLLVGRFSAGSSRLDTDRPSGRRHPETPTPPGGEDHR